MSFLLALAFWMLSTGKSRLTIYIEQDPVAIQCRIPLDASNRHVNVGVDGYFSSGIPLEGLPSDPPHVRRSVPPLLCDSGERSAVAFCELFWAPNGYTRATAQVPCIP